MVLRAYTLSGPTGAPTLADIMSVSTIAAGQTYFLSNVGSTVIPAFAGGTLQVDETGGTNSQNFIVDGSATNRLDLRGNSVVLTGVLSDAVPGTPGKLIIANSGIGGRVIFAGASTYTGLTTIEAGATLSVDGSIGSLADACRRPLGGGGSFNSLVQNGGVLAPGNSIGTLTVNGNLSFAPGSVYLVEVAPGAADRTNVSGSASLQGTAVASFASGNYTPVPQVVLSAAGGRSGTFGSLLALGLPPGLLASLSYTPSDVMVNLTAVLGAGTTLTANQSNVAGALNNSFNTGNSLPGGMAGLFNQSGQTLAASLELAVRRGAVRQCRSQPSATATSSSTPCWPAAQPAAARQGVQYASLTAAEAEPGPRRLRGWLTGFGGYGWLGGTPSNGSSGVQTSAQGLAAGADWSFDHGLAGVAVSGGTSNWFLDGSLGNGRASVFQIGLYGRAMLDPVYLAAATAWGRQGVSTQRPVPFLGDWLGASYTATTWSGRLEAGHRFALQEHGLTPFVAVQSQVVNMPGFCETSQVNSGAALCFNGNATWSLRSELGLELDADVGTILGSKASLGARLSWAHEYQTTGAVSAWFQSLPGSNFAVSGAPLPQDAGIVRVTSNLALDEAWSLRLQADAEFGNNYGSIAGTARLARPFSERDGFRLSISGLSEVVGAFGWRREGRISAMALRWRRRCAWRPFAAMLELGEELLDRVEVGRVFGQEEEPGPGGADGPPHGAAPVRAEIVHDDDVAWLAAWGRGPPRYRQEALAVDRAVDQPGRLDAVVAQGGQEGHGLPAAVRHLAGQALAAVAPSRSAAPCWSWSRSRR